MLHLTRPKPKGQRIYKIQQNEQIPKRSSLISLVFKIKRFPERAKCICFMFLIKRFSSEIKKKQDLKYFKSYACANKNLMIAMIL